MQPRSEHVQLSKMFMEASSGMNPLAAQAAALIILTAAGAESSPLGLIVILATSIAVTSAYSRKPLDVLRFMLIFTPLGLGLGIFYGLVSGRSVIDAVAVMWMRISSLVSVSSLLYYCVDPWEMAGSLSGQMRLPRAFAYTLGIALTLYRRMLRDLAEILDSLRSRRIIAGWPDYILKVDKILYILVYTAYRRAEEMEAILASRSFDPERRRERKTPKMKARDVVTLFFLAFSAGVALLLL